MIKLFTGLFKFHITLSRKINNSDFLQNKSAVNSEYCSLQMKIKNRT